MSPSSTLQERRAANPPAQPAPGRANCTLRSKTFYARRVRRVLDLFVLCLTLPAALPVSFLVAVANAIALGGLRHVLFLQERVGRGGKIFRIVKFRTMRPVQETDMESWSSGGDQQRVTPFGRFLRNAHLDELPQLWNVLLGDMGFMGPRPEMVEIEAWASEHILDFSERLQIRPGISGLAQITQGYTPKDVTAYQRKLAINLAYLERLSFWTDLQVFCGTIVWVLGRKGWKWEGSSFPAQGMEGERSMTQTAPLPSEP